MLIWQKITAALGRLQWTRGLRAGVAVAAAMIVCHLLGKPMGWAALGGFEAILVDNGGPYRSRLATIATLLAGGSLGCVLGAVSWEPLALAMLVTAAFCFAFTFARVLAQPIASSSVIILVIYFAGLGGEAHQLQPALENALLFVLGGAWAAVLSVVLWPVDPFRPARRAVAACYTDLAAFTASLATVAADHEAHQTAHDFQRTMRQRMEQARAALETTAARMTARTIRARSLTVLLETADMLFAETIRWSELARTAEDDALRQQLSESLQWLAGAERAIARGLDQRPADGGSSYTREGSHALEHLRGRAEAIAAHEQAGMAVVRRLAADERDALQNIEIAFSALRAAWSGIEERDGGVVRRWAALTKQTLAPPERSWLDALAANWTLHSVMTRHALRIAVVGAADVVLMRLGNIHHGSWMGMTSIIVLQPYRSGTLRKGMQRVGGTVAGGILAALLAAAIHSQAGIIAVVSLTSILTLATYAVDYAWYCFFLTPTFVLMSMPRLRDWHFAGVRIGTTLVGALVAVAAMRLLWPEQEHVELDRLLGRGAEAAADYARAMLRFWKLPPSERQAAERELLAPSRRRCGLAVSDLQETLDRLLLEPRFPRRGVATPELDGALTISTYLLRLTRVITTLSILGPSSFNDPARIEAVALRMEALARALETGAPLPTTAFLPERPEQTSGTLEPESLQAQQIRRMERQAGVMERAAATLHA